MRSFPVLCRSSVGEYALEWFVLVMCIGSAIGSILTVLAELSASFAYYGRAFQVWSPNLLHQEIVIMYSIVVNSVSADCKNEEILRVCCPSVFFQYCYSKDPVLFTFKI